MALHYKFSTSNALDALHSPPILHLGMDYLLELARPSLGHRTDTSIQPFGANSPVAALPATIRTTLKKNHSRPINTAVHPFSDYNSRNSPQSLSSSGRASAQLPLTSHIVQPFTDDRPPDTESHLTPTTMFKIGKLTTPGPLVSITELKGHLALLYAFSELKKTVEASDINPFLRTPSQSVHDAKWTWFVGLAVERFDIWCRALKTDSIVEGEEKCLPPIDVLMVWHAYMLNPRWYAEDTIRIVACKRLRMLELNFTAIMENPALLDIPPSDARMEHWRSLTSLPFDPLKGMYIHTTRLLECPCCRTENEVELGNQLGTGYLQHNFTATCSNIECDARAITKETLAHRKLAWDIAASSSSRNPGSRLAGSAFPKSSETTTGELIQRQILSDSKADQAISTVDWMDTSYINYIHQLDHELRCKAVMKYQGSLHLLKGKISNHYKVLIVKRILSAYTSDKLYSIDLIEAVLKQTKFIQQISELGWIRPDYFHQHGDELSFHHALARYHAFLDLENSSLNMGCIPTLDIDFVWHTHQLMPTEYYTDLNLYLKRFLDHDTVDTQTFSSGFARTSHAWQVKFNAPYTHCGCVAPANSISDRFSRLVNLKPKNVARAAVLPHSISATHPSDHHVHHEL